MITILTVAQTLFYFSVSFAIIALGIMLGMVVYHLIKVAKSLEKISENVGQISDDLQESVEQSLQTLSSLPIFSMFFRKKETKVRRKKRKV
ncbi:hypothetical protein KKG48_00595 [Patescibacteria group bacterium]|nr:hypothetical protein [Patescibacteria group bacterium]MCG2694881.1 hypothetical protein [Candidatus Parcubacteria bacterium]